MRVHRRCARLWLCKCRGFRLYCRLVSEPPLPLPVAHLSPFRMRRGRNHEVLQLGSRIAWGCHRLWHFRHFGNLRDRKRASYKLLPAPALYTDPGRFCAPPRSPVSSGWFRPLRRVGMAQLFSFICGSSCGRFTWNLVLSQVSGAHLNPAVTLALMANGKADDMSAADGAM